jgi:hypothetical protein
MNRSYLKGETGERLHAVLRTVGYNIRWPLRMIVKRRVTFLPALFLHLRKAAVLRQVLSEVKRKLLGSTQMPLASQMALG